jgi:hypothetical protein
MDYVTNRSDAHDRVRIELHLQNCSSCRNEYNKLSATEAVLNRGHDAVPAPAYFSSILPRVREQLVARKRPLWDYDTHAMKIIIPLAVSALFVILLLRIPANSVPESAQTEALHQAVIDFNDDEIMQAIEKEYSGIPLSSGQEVAAAGVAEHLQGDRFLKSEVSKQIENEEIAEMDVEGMISDLDGEQVDQVLSGLTERDIL